MLEFLIKKITKKVFIKWKKFKVKQTKYNVPKRKEKKKKKKKATKQLVIE